MSDRPVALSRRRATLIVIAAAAVVIILVVAIVLVFSSSTDNQQSGPTRTTSPSSTTTSTAPPTTTTAPPSTPTTLGASTLASASGALLQPVPPPVLQSTSGPDTDCHSLGHTGWTVAQCNTFSRTGPAGAEHVVALVESKASGGVAKAWRAYMLHWSQGKGAWLVDLVFTDDTGTQMSSISYVFKDMTGDGVDEVVFGFRLLGSGSVLDYDIVGNIFDSVAVAVHRELSHGQASVSTTGVVDWDAKYEGGAPNCCPTYFQQSQVRWSGGAWLIVPGPHVNGAGSGDF